MTEDGHGCARFVCMANAPSDSPFMPGAFHGTNEADVVVNVAVSGAGVIRRLVEANRAVPYPQLSLLIKDRVGQITRVGEMVGRRMAEKLGYDFGSIDLSLAPAPNPPENSIAGVIEGIGVERCGTHGSTAALALLVDAVKKGGAAAATSVGGLSGTFIPISEDVGMIDSIRAGALTLDKAEAMTAVCSVGLDMFGIPGDTPVTTMAGIIADELAIGTVNNKTTAVRMIPVPGAHPWACVDLTKYDDLLGKVIVLPIKAQSSAGLFEREPIGRVPAPIKSLTN